MNIYFAIQVTIISNGLIYFIIAETRKTLGQLLIPSKSDKTY